MNAEQAVDLCRYTAAACPQQHFDELTPLAWADLLADLRLEDARAALRNLAKTQTFISPAEIRTEVRRIRARRIREHGPIDPPSYLTDDEQRHYLAATRRAIADGNPPTAITTRAEDTPLTEMEQERATLRG